MSKKYYVVWQGLKPGIYDSWPQAQAQVKGRKDAQFMGFESFEQASQAYAQPYAKALAARNKASGKANTSGKKSSTNSKATIKAKTKAAAIKNSADVNIYSDGACSPNPGKAGTGIAIYYGDKLNSLWYGLFEPNGTNNSAELYGLLEAFKMAQHFVKQNLSVQVLSDSKYSIDCITKWASGWRKKGWTRPNNEPIKNLPLIQQCHQLYLDLQQHITITHVRGHVDIEGNELADRMAVQARTQRQTQFIKYPHELDIKAILAMPSG